LVGRPSRGCSPGKVEHVGDAARHAGREVAPGLARAPPRCRRSCTRSRGRPCLRPPRWRPTVAHAKRSPPRPLKKASPVVAPYITVLPTMMLRVGVAAEVDARAHDDAPARQALAGVVVGVADQVQRDAALGQEGAEALAARAFELMRMVSSGRPSGALGDLAPDSIAPTVRLTLRMPLHELTLSRRAPTDRLKSRPLAFQCSIAFWRCRAGRRGRSGRRTCGCPAAP
jgi:hypothetical protein